VKIPDSTASEDDGRFMEGFVTMVDGLLAEGKIRAHPVSMREGGLGGGFGRAEGDEGGEGEWGEVSVSDCGYDRGCLRGVAALCRWGRDIHRRKP